MAPIGLIETTREKASAEAEDRRPFHPPNGIYLIVCANVREMKTTERPAGKRLD